MDRVTADRYREQLQALLPQGAAWPRRLSTVWSGLLSGLAQELARVDGRGVDLIDEALPDTTVELLPDWERVLGLPDGCLPREDTMQARREAVLAKLNAVGGQHAAYYIALADELGYAGAWVEEFHPFTATSLCTDPLNTDPWCFVWVLHVPQLPPGNEATDRALECLIARYRPAHTHVVVRYANRYIRSGYIKPGYFKGG
ncbi:YmfQ family protein [Pseudoxanthomonas sp. UTMC 1351]|uniref:YmfQ family protein n=1 Tax=Pseudoxanthomonas sp. UTMC 1351 TaxID=2695853 RepID=UPI0034CD6BA4